MGRDLGKVVLQTGIEQGYAQGKREYVQMSRFNAILDASCSLW